MTFQLIKQLFYLTVILYFLPSCSSGQATMEAVYEVRSVTLQKEDGDTRLELTMGSQAGDNVHTSLEDKNGTLWFGTTNEGLYSFDGQSFRQFTTADGLTSNFIFHLHEDKQGKIWIGTEDGLVVYDGSEFKPQFINTSITSIHGKFTIFSITQDTDDLIWIATVAGVYTYDGVDYRHFPIDEEGNGFLSPKSNMEYVMQDRQGSYWFGCRTKSGVFRYDGNTVQHYDLEMQNGHDWAWPVLQDQRGNIWFNNWGGVYRYDGNRFTAISSANGLMEGPIMRIIEDSRGVIWFGGAKGLCSFDGKAFTHYGPFEQGVWSLIEDSSGALWIGARNTELYRLSDGVLYTY